MRKVRYIIPVWILILSILLQSTVYAEIQQEVINTAPEANFTVEKNHNVKIMVLTDYTGTDNADLKNMFTSMKSELTSSAKIDIEFANPVTTTIGSQNGQIKMNTWGKNAYASYTWSGYRFYQQSKEPVWIDYWNQKENEKFVYSNTTELPEGEEPTAPYGVPIRHVKSGLQRTVRDEIVYSLREFYTYSFINNNGICDGTFEIIIKHDNRSPSGLFSEGWVSSYTEPVFTYEDFWSIQSSYDQSIKNDVIAWDLSTLNYEIQDNTDTFVVFALNRGNTNYYKAYKDSNYMLGQLRSDSNLGKYIKEADARVYSICSDDIENINLSANAEYPITYSPALKAQNISIKDLIESSFDGRSVGEKNITGLENKIKENIRRPNGNIDMIVASDNDKTSLSNFVENIRNSVSDDVSLSANIIDGDSFEDTDTWTKYITKGDYKSFTMYNSDATLILTGNGELWGMGSNFIGEVQYAYEKWKKVYGLFGLDPNVERYDKFVKITDNVKEVYLKYLTNGNCIFIIKNDGTLWVSGGYTKKYVEDRKGNTYDTVNYFQGFNYTGYSDVKSLAFHMINTWEMHIVSGNGVFRCLMDRDWEYSPPMKDTLAPANTKYLRGGGYSESSQLIYVGEDGKSTYSSWKYGYLKENKLYAYSSAPLPANPVAVSQESLIFKCSDGKYYNIHGTCITNNLNIKTRQFIVNQGIHAVSEDGQLYSYMSNWGWGKYASLTNIDKILFMESSGGLIVRTLDGKIAFYNKIKPENTFRTEDLKLYEGEKSIYDSTYNKLVEFDATAGGLVADYLQIGDRFCYVTKQGDICYVVSEYKGRDDNWIHTTSYKTVNCGKLDSIFDISYKTVKAISKSKIFNTPLREGSERYFIYVSDNVQQDTYFGDYTEYFPFSHLDYPVLSYLNANRFNIYIVTPKQARNLKLAYPYVPVNRQQLSLKELIYSSVMDSAFCKDTDTVRKLIEKRYDTYTKQGSTTLTLLVNEESVRYNQVYRDFENDPKYSERWLYTHDPTYFDNSNGLDSNSGKWILTPLYTFSKVGKYVVSAQFRDNTKDDNRFDNYRLWSNKSAPATIFVHRRPIALFSTQISEKKSSNVFLTYLDQSYDLDHNKSRTDKGIAQRKWQYKKVDSDTWIDGKPTNLTYNTGKYEIQLMVRDIEGAWSKPYIDTIDTSDLPPAIYATPDSYNGAGPVYITITATDNGEDDFAYMRYAVTNSTELPASSQWIKVEEGEKEKSIALNTDGWYYLHMEAYDKIGQTGKNLAGPYIINNVKAGNFFITMMLDVGWRAYYFDLDRGIDDNRDGMIDRYPRRPNTDIGTLKMPINYYSLVSSPRTYIKAGYRVKGRIDIQGNPDSARFKINYKVKETIHTDTVNLVKDSGDTYTFEWIIPLDTDDRSFISFDLEMNKGSITYGNEKWNDIWDTRNSSRYVFYVCGKVTDDLIYIQSQ